MTNFLFTLGILTGLLSLVLAFLGTTLAGMAAVTFGASIILILVALLSGKEPENTDDPGP